MAEFVKAASTNEIAPGQARLVTVKGRDIVLFNIEGAFFALENACTHAEGPLAEGEVLGHEVTCAHGMVQSSTSGRERSSVHQPMKPSRATACASGEPTSRSSYSDHHETRQSRGHGQQIGSSRCPSQSLQRFNA